MVKRQENKGTSAIKRVGYRFKSAAGTGWTERERERNYFGRLPCVLAALMTDWEQKSLF